MRWIAISMLCWAVGCGHGGWHGRFAGPQHFKMPELRGASGERAEKQLRAAGKLGLVDWREEDCGGEFAVGAVCATYPAAGCDVMKREPIVVYVQLPRPVGGAAPSRAPMPDVVGQRVEAAKATLAAAGFTKVSVRYLAHDGCAAATVCGVGPRPGATGHHALVKVLYVGKEPAAPPPPPPAPAPLKPHKAPKPVPSFF